jgi:hypothetical protein
MFSKPLGFGKLHYTKSIWSAWETLGKSVYYNLNGKELPSFWAMEDVINIIPLSIYYSDTQNSRTILFFGKIQVTKVRDLWNRSTNTWKNFDTKLTRVRGLPDWVFMAIKDILVEIHTAQGRSAPLEMANKQSKGISITAGNVYHIML